MNYLKLMSILSERMIGAADVAKKSTKKDEKDDFTRSKADQAFKDMHKVDVTTEKDFESLGPITTKQHDDHKGNPSDINVGDAKQKSVLSKFNKGDWGKKNSYRTADNQAGEKAMPKVDDGATKVLIPKPTDSAKTGEDLHSTTKKIKEELKKKIVDVEEMKQEPQRAYRKLIDMKPLKSKEPNVRAVKEPARAYASVKYANLKVKEEVESKSRAEYEKTRKEAQKNIDTFRAAQKAKTKAAASAHIGTKVKEEVEIDENTKRASDNMRVAAGVMSKQDFKDKWHKGGFKNTLAKKKQRTADIDKVMAMQKEEHKVGDKVIATVGPHKGKVHTVIHKYDNEDKYNIRPDVHVKANRYPQGAASASGSKLQKYKG